MDTVLIVDDDRQTRKFWRLALQKEGFKVLEACNGNECLWLYQEKSPDVVLIDLIMPEKDGVTTIDEIKKQNKGSKVIAISGGGVFFPETYLDEAEIVGADATLSKPISRDDLISAVRNVLN